jgi:4-amino-4-deoxy-L-arabinose transferase-like glycosyltransferase
VDASGLSVPRNRRLLLGALLAVAALMRLYHFQAPLLDQLYVKQVHVANHARNIARAPLNPLRFSFDFLDEQGRPMVLTEEVPLYNGLLGASYHLCGEHDWLGRVWSLLAILLATLAVHDLFRREYDGPTGLAAAFLFAMAPLSIFWGRAVLPDPWMLACMVLALAFYRRHLDDGERPAWLVAAALAGLGAALFKTYGLLVLAPLADMAYRHGGWRAWFGRKFVLLVAVLTVPIALWMVTVFLRVPNPTAHTAYFFWQVPGSLGQPRLYVRLTHGMFFNDCGPVAAVLIVLGIAAALAGKERSRPLWGWSAAGVLYLFAFAPKLMDHDYYELIVLPVLAGWGALGWRAVARRVRRRRPRAAVRAAVAIVVLATVVHSPLVMNGKYELEIGHFVVAQRLNALCPPDGRVVVLGQRIGWPEVHYSGRQGWVEQWGTLPADWRGAFARYRAGGAEYAAVYFDPTVTLRQRASFTPLLASLPVVEHRVGPWFRRGRPCEYYILNLGARPADLAAGPRARR